MKTYLPGFQSFFCCFFLHHFVLGKVATSSIRVTYRSMCVFYAEFLCCVFQPASAAPAAAAAAAADDDDDSDEDLFGSDSEVSESINCLKYFSINRFKKSLCIRTLVPTHLQHAT